jgi:hypothetical protein
MISLLGQPNYREPFLKRDLFLILILSALIALSNIDYFIGLHRVFHDSNVTILSWRLYLSDSFKAGEFPFWNPFSTPGIPTGANIQGGFYSPVSIVLALFPGYSPGTFALEILIFQMTGAVGCFYWLRRHLLNRVLCFTGSFVYIKSGSLESVMANANALFSMCILPWLFLGIDMVVGRYRDDREYWRIGAAIYGLALWLMIVSGYPSVTVVAFLWSFIWGFFKFPPTKKGLGQLFSGFSLGCIIAGLLSIFVISEFLNFFYGSFNLLRGNINPYLGALSIKSMLAFFWPNPVFIEMKGAYQFLYMGIIIFSALFLGGIWGKKKRREWLLIIILLLSLFSILPERAGVSIPFTKIILKWFKWHAWFSCIPTFAGITLAMHWIQLYSKVVDFKKIIKKIIILWASAALLTFYVIASNVPARLHVTRKELFFLLVYCLIIGVLILLKIKKNKYRIFTGALFSKISLIGSIIIISFGIVLVLNNNIVTKLWGIIYQKLNFLQGVITISPWIMFGCNIMFVMLILFSAYYLTVKKRNAGSVSYIIVMDMLITSQVVMIGDTYRLYHQSPFDVKTQLFRQVENAREFGAGREWTAVNGRHWNQAILDKVPVVNNYDPTKEPHIRYLVEYQADDELKQIWRKYFYKIIRFGNKVMFVDSKEEAFKKALTYGAGPFEQTVIDKEKLSEYDVNLLSGLSSSQKIDTEPRKLEITPNKFIFHVYLIKPGLIIITDAWKYGWEARINGKLTKVYRVWGCIKGIVAPAGESNIVLKYRPPYFKSLIALFFGGVLVCLILIFHNL